MSICSSTTVRLEKIGNNLQCNPETINFDCSLFYNIVFSTGGQDVSPVESKWPGQELKVELYAYGNSALKAGFKAPVTLSMGLFIRCSLVLQCCLYNALMYNSLFLHNGRFIMDIHQTTVIFSNTRFLFGKKKFGRAQKIFTPSPPATFEKFSPHHRGH